MKLNIFSIPVGEVACLRNKITEAGMGVIAAVDQDGWAGNFYCSLDDSSREVPWTKPFRSFFDGGILPKSRSPFAVFLFTKKKQAFAISYGKSHFYVRPFCDYDFGIELAKRIANRDDTRQTAAKRFSGRERKSIKSFSNSTRLNFESGESVDFIQSAIRSAKTDDFGATARFGTSAQITVEMTVGDIGTLLTKIVKQLKKPARFTLPRTTLLTDAAEIQKFDEELLTALQGPAGVTDFAHNSYDLYGVDFVFRSVGSYTLKYARKSKDYEVLTMLQLKAFITDMGIPRDKIFDIRVVHHQEDAPVYIQDLKQVIDFISDSERVILTAGRWMRFNQDYLDFLDNYLRGLKVEVTEPTLLETYMPEGAFNDSDEVRAQGYLVADKDFSIFKTRSSTPVEAWDLQRGETVYAVKFGTAQKLGYVCDQATAVLELLRNRAEAQQVPHFQEYCLWLGYRAKHLPANIADTGSIILKQKIEAWARKCVEMGVTPVIKLSHPLRRGIDDGETGASDTLTEV